MMFIMHSAFFLGLLALAAGVSLFIWGRRREGAGIVWAKFFGVIIIIFSILDIICLTYYGVTYWREGYFENPTPMTQNKSMMGGSMMNGGNSPNMMNEQMNMNQSNASAHTHKH